MQRLRRRQRGVNVEDLTVGEVTQKEDKGKASKSHVPTHIYRDTIIIFYGKAIFWVWSLRVFDGCLGQ